MTDVPQSGSYSASVVVATRDRAHFLKDCLTALRAMPTQPQEIVVVDNADGAGDTDTATVASEFGATYTHIGGTGLSGARNHGARRTTSDLVAFIDDDAIAAPDWLEALLGPFADERIVAVTGRVIGREIRTPDHAAAAAIGWLDFGVDGRVWDGQSEDWFERANFGGMGRGMNMAFRRSAFDQWRGFRTSFGLGAPLPGGEENYAFFELIRLGHAIRYEPRAVVTHPYPDDMALRQRKVLAQAIAYLLILYQEEPEYRHRITTWVRWHLRWWRDAVPDGATSRHRRPLPWWQVAASVGRGFVLYARAVRADRRVATPSVPG